MKIVEKFDESKKNDSWKDTERNDNTNWCGNTINPESNIKEHHSGTKKVKTIQKMHKIFTNIGRVLLKADSDCIGQIISQKINN